MIFRFNPERQILTVARDVSAYNAQKRAKAFWLLELLRAGVEHNDDCCVDCGARVDLSDIDTFELTDYGMVCYFCTCNPDEPLELRLSSSLKSHSKPTSAGKAQQ